MKTELQRLHEQLDKLLKSDLAILTKKAKPLVYDIKDYTKDVEELKNKIQRQEWMQETVDAFADINAECEAERKEEEEFQQSLRKPKH